MTKDIITTVEGNKIWGYVAMGAGALAVVGIALLVKEELDARKVSNNLRKIQAELKSVKEGIQEGAKSIIAKGKEIVGEGNEGGSGFSGYNSLVSPVKGFTSSWRPHRQTYQAPENS